MNEILKQLEQFPNGAKVSLFLEWSHIDHTFEEVRIWLADIMSELKRKNLDVPSKIEEIMEDQRVFGSELNLKQRLLLGEKDGVFYFSGDRLLAVDMPLHCRDCFFIDDEFMILPMLKSNQSFPVLALLVRKEMVKVYKVSNYHIITDITESFRFPENMKELTGLDQGLFNETFQEQSDLHGLKREGAMTGRKPGEELVKRYVKEIVEEISKSFKSFHKVHVFSSEKIGHLFKQQVEKINKNVKVQTHSYVAFDTSSRVVHNLLREKVIESENVQNFGQLQNFRLEPVTDVKEIVWDQEMGNLKSLTLNQEWLENNLGKDETPEQLKTLNRFVLNCLRQGVAVGLSRTVDGLFVGELRGPRVRPPSTFDFSPYEQIGDLKY